MNHASHYASDTAMFTFPSLTDEEMNDLKRKQGAPLAHSREQGFGWSWALLQCFGHLSSSCFSVFTHTLLEQRSLWLLKNPSWKFPWCFHFDINEGNYFLWQALLGNYIFFQKKKKRVLFSAIVPCVYSNKSGLMQPTLRENSSIHLLARDFTSSLEYH